MDVIVYVEREQGEAIAESKSDVLQGTVDLMVLKTLESMGRFTATASAGESNRRVTTAPSN
jgi:hypothetical protein